jgi:hypothetical protein
MINTKIAGGRLVSLLVTEIDSTGEFPDDQEVNALQPFRANRRSSG